MKSIRKVWQQKYNSLLLFSVNGKGYILPKNIVWENEVYAIISIVKFLFVLEDTWNEVMKHQRPQRSPLVL